MTILVNALAVLGLSMAPVVILLVVRRLGRRLGLDYRYNLRSRQPGAKKW
jgi:hypothetical protein